MEPALSRRAALRSVSAGLVLLAGCTGAASRTGADCTTAAEGHGDGGVLQEAPVRPDGEFAVLRVVLLADAVDRADLDRLVVTDAAGDVAHVVPVGDDRVHEVSVGRIPTAGEYRIAVEDDAGTELDWLALSFDCPGADE